MEVAQSVSYHVSYGISGALLAFFVILGLAYYIWYSLCLYKIAKKLGVEPAWLAFVPIGNAWVMSTCGGYPGAWFLLLIVPCVNIVFLVFVWMKIARFLGKGETDVLYGILMLIPIANLIIPGILAFGETTVTQPPMQQPMQPPYQQPPQQPPMQPPYQPPAQQPPPAAPQPPQVPPQAPQPPTGQQPPPAPTSGGPGGAPPTGQGGPPSPSQWK